MTIIPKLASSLNRRDEVPNQELAKQVVAKNDSNAVKELVENLHNKNKNIQSDCIKVLYEIGERKPAMIVDYTKDLVALLDSKNNRLQWGAMAALDTVTSENPKLIYSFLGKIMAAADNGSVITRDRAVNILIQLCPVKQYAENAFSLLLEQLAGCPENQLAMYSARALPIIAGSNKENFIRVLVSRIPGMERDTLRKRVEKVIKKLS